MNAATPLIIILVTLTVSLLGLIGGLLLIWREQMVKRGSHLLISFAAGSLLGASFLELLPEAAEHSPDNLPLIFVSVLIGIFAFFILEKLLVWHHHSHEHSDGTQHEETLSHRFFALQPLVIIGDAIHNLLDGAIIAIAFLSDPALGFITALAVIAHEIPQEIGDFSVLIHSGMRRGRVLLWNIIGAVISPLGAVLVLLSRDIIEQYKVPLLGFVVGNFIYIALADLIPAIQHERRLRRSLVQIAFIILGIIIVWQIGLFLPHAD